MSNSIQTPSAIASGVQSLPGAFGYGSLQFTRYLYIKDEVKLSILISLLKKNREALFWAYEFYYSGFSTELWAYFWTIYYDFYASLNQHFKKFLFEKQQKWNINIANKNYEEADKIIAQIINNFHIRPWNTDVFLLRHFVQPISLIEGEHLNPDISLLLENMDYEQITHYILHNSFGTEDINKVAHYFCEERKIITKNKATIWKKQAQNACKEQIISDIIHFYSLATPLKMGRPLYVVGKDENISEYQTIYTDQETKFYSYKILPKACKYAIDSEHLLGLFHLQRDSCPELIKMYHYNWLYYAASTPIWAERIQKFGGTINNESKTIVFDNIENEEEFHDIYNLEPDEQPAEVQEKNIGCVKQDITYKIFESKKGIYIPKEELWSNKKVYH